MEPEDFAKRIRDACLEAVLQAYEDAGVQGLCAEGRWEVAVVLFQRRMDYREPLSRSLLKQIL